MGSNGEKGQKDFLTAALLSLFLGVLGIDRFYLGYIGTGILKLVTFGGLGIWYLIDLILIYTGSLKSANKKPLANRTKNLKTAIIILAVYLALLILLGATSPSSTKSNTSTKQSKQTTTSTTTTPAKPKPTATTPANSTAPSTQAAPTVTVSQKNAVNKAKEYLSTQAFSHDELIDQLVFDKFSTTDATYGVDNSGGDWNAQAAAKAKEYMSTQSFSRQGLIDQLVFDKFTQDQATYGVNSVGL